MENLKKLLLTFMLLLVCGIAGAQNTKGTKVAMLVPNDYKTNENAKKAKAAVEWFTKTYVDKGHGTVFVLNDNKVIAPTSSESGTQAQADTQEATLNVTDYPVCWVMCSRIILAGEEEPKPGWDTLPGGLADNATINALKAYCAAGGNLLLTNHATQLTVALERLPEKYAPNVVRYNEIDNTADQWGASSLIGNANGEIYDHSKHAIYSGLEITSNANSYYYPLVSAGEKYNHNSVWDLDPERNNGITEINLRTEIAEKGYANTIAAWEGETNSTVLGTWQHVTYNNDYAYENASVVDFHPTKEFHGRILTIGLGAYCWGKPDGNDYQRNLELFTENCLKYLGYTGNTIRTYCTNNPNDEIEANKGKDCKPMGTDIKIYGAYKFESKDDNKIGNVRLYEMNYIPKGQGVILIGTDVDNVEFEEYTVETGVTKYKNISDNDYKNYLVGVWDKDITVNASVFDGESNRTHRNFFFNYLSNSGYYKDGEDDYLGFFRIKSNSICRANHAYLSLPTDLLTWDGQTLGDILDAGSTSSSKGIQLIFGIADENSGSVTGITNIEKEVKADDSYYTLQGIKVGIPSKGIYIHKGKKVIIK